MIIREISQNAEYRENGAK